MNCDCKLRTATCNLHLGRAFDSASLAPSEVHGAVTSYILFLFSFLGTEPCPSSLPLIEESQLHYMICNLLQFASPSLVDPSNTPLTLCHEGNLILACPFTPQLPALQDMSRDVQFANRASQTHTRLRFRSCPYCHKRMQSRSLR